MSIDVETKDTTALSDGDIAELADLCAESPIAHEIGTISKEAENWVLITRARSGTKLKGFSFATLERIGGTPCVLIGLAEIHRSSTRDTVLNKIVAENLRRAVLAFPDEHVLVASRFAGPDGFEAFKPLVDVVPREGHRPGGEDRAWGRRLAKRFGVQPSRYEQREFVVRSDGNLPLVFDHECSDRSRVSSWEPVFGSLGDGDSVLGFGWALAEDLEKFA